MEITLFGPCPECGLMASYLDIRRNDDGGGSWNCLQCGYQYGVWVDGGELELGYVVHDHYELARD